MFKKMRNEMLVTNMLIITALVMICFTAIHITTSTYINRDIAQRLEREVNMFRGEMERRMNGEIPPDMMRKEDDEAGRHMPREDMFNSEMAVYCDKDGNILESRSNFSVDEFDYSEKISDILASDKIEGSVHLDVDSWAYKRAEFDEGYIIAFTRNESEKHIMLMLNIVLGAAALFSIGGSLVISLFSANRSIRPIEEAYEKQKQFVADASHELRTPLASICANIDVLLSKRDGIADDERKWLTYVKDEAERMTVLTNDLLTLARSDAEDDRKVYPEVSISDIADDVLLENEAVAFENGVELVSDIEPGIIVMAPPQGLKQLILILTDNAIKYTPKNGKIDISLKRENGKVIFTVENDGSIDSEDLPHIFERFYRADRSRARESGGYGLGLAIAHSLTKSMGGSIKAESADGKTRFTVII